MCGKEESQKSTTKDGTSKNVSIFDSWWLNAHQNIHIHQTNLEFNTFSFSDKKWHPPEFGSRELQHTSDPHHQQSQPPNHHEALPAHWQAPPHARQYAIALRKGQYSRWWPAPNLNPQHAPEVRKVLESDSAVCKVPRYPSPGAASQTCEKESILETS